MTSAVPTVARGEELAEVGRFLDAVPRGPRCLLLEGEVGIGKTTVLNQARDAAAARGFLVLSAAPVEMEVPWEFVALADLLGSAPRWVVEELPEPQRRAVEVSVFRQAVSDEPVDPRTLATSVLKVLRRLAEATPVLLVVDDLPWLDLPSAQVLSYVLRRAGGSAIGLLGAVRIEWGADPAPLATDAVDPALVERLRIGPLPLEAIGDLLSGRSAPVPSRTGLARVYELSRGNPLFALELVRENAAGLGADPNRSLGLPDSLRRLVRHRLRPLAEGAREVLLLSALSGEPHEDVVAATADPQWAAGELDRAVKAGIIVRRDGALAFAHPLIRSVVADDATADERREAHRRLASVARHAEVAARHLALGAAGPDEAVARAVEEAARSAAARGASETAATLAELATSLTPVDRVDDRRRRIGLEADNRYEAGDPVRARTLLEPVIAEREPGPERAELMLRSARYGTALAGPVDWVSMLTTALEECGDDLALRLDIAVDLAVAAHNFGDQDVARQASEQAVALATQVGDGAREALIHTGVAFWAFQRGEGVDPDLVTRALAGPDQPPRLAMELRPRVVVGHILHLSDDLDGARALYEVEYERATAEGIGTALPLLLWGMIETEAWAGNWDRAEELIAEGTDLADGVAGPIAAVMLMMTGLLHAYRGRVEEAVDAAGRAVALALEIGWAAMALIGAQALGLVGLSLGDPEATHRRLLPVMALVEAVGVTEPGFFHFLPDEIEALVRLGQLEEAERLLVTLEERSTAVGRVWGLAAAARCRGLLLAARGEAEAAEAAIAGALELHERLPIPFERGRTLLVAGEVNRRARRKRLAREALQSAAAIFDDLGSPGWAQLAREELGRLGLRSRTAADGDQLTEAERRVVDLVVAGHTNAEVAAQLFMAERTVESHLTRAYRKLGVRSRTQLARALRGD